MVITCAIVCIHNVCVFVCVKGDNIAVSRERPWFRGSLWLYSEKTVIPQPPTALAVGGHDVAV